MPALTRRAVDNAHQETWHVYYGDIHIGAIAERAGVPKDVEQWEWNVGFFPRSHRGHSESGTAASFREARADFERAWDRYLIECTAQDFTDFRRQRDWTAWKYRMRDEGCLMPGQVPQTGVSRCFCGTEITLETTDRHVIESHSLPVPDGGP
jgi:hypothetical protein